jgi:MFS family permease
VPADRLVVFFTCGLRNLAYGMSSVMLGLYLTSLGVDRAAIGAIFTAALAGGALLTVAFSGVADRFGRRRSLALAAGLMALSTAAFAITTQPALLAITAALGAANPSSKELGPFGPIEQSILPQVVSQSGRTWTFAAYNMVSSFAGALGALAVGLPGLLGAAGVGAYRGLVWAYAAMASALLLLYLLLSDNVEAQPSQRRRFGLHESRSIVFRLAGLFAVDAFAGGFVVQSILALWFALRYGIGAGDLALIFFWANVASALSFLAAAPLARRIGLLNTMVFTHLPSNVLLLLVPLMPNLQLAVGLVIARFLLSQLDVPTRQSYTMAIVPPEERSAAAGFTSLARNAAQAIAPAFTAATLAVPALGVPFLVGGSLKIAYDLSILAAFRKLRPPEERA